MARKLLLTVVLYTLALCLSTPAFAFPADIKNVCFSPNGGCARLIVNQINQAHKQIRVLAYDFTSPPIGKALIRAEKRGVSVEIVMDGPGALNQYSEVPYLLRANIPVYADYHKMMQHNKVMIIDSATVITGSFNFTRAANRDNAENLIILKSLALSQKYLENWEYHAGHSRRLR